MKNFISLKKQVSKIPLVVFALIIGITFTSCEDLFEYDLAEANSKADLTPPAANFTATVSNDYLIYNFSNTSVSATDYVWSFGFDGDGDGNIDTSTETDAEYEFPGEGTYTVTLTASDKLNVSNTFSMDIEVVKPAVPPAINPEIKHGDFNDNPDGKYSWDEWKIDSFTDGTRNPYNASSDGDPVNYEGVDTGSKTRGAKWTGSTSAGPSLSSSSRFSYQALTVTPNTEYLVEFSYAIKTDKADIDGGDRVVLEILDGWFSDGKDVLASGTNLTKLEGTTANGKGNFEVVKKLFTSNATGEIAIWIYAITNDELYVDNVKLYPL